MAIENGMVTGLVGGGHPMYTDEPEFASYSGYGNHQVSERNGDVNAQIDEMLESMTKDELLEVLDHIQDETDNYDKFLSIAGFERKDE